MLGPLQLREDPRGVVALKLSSRRQFYCAQITTNNLEDSISANANIDFKLETKISSLNEFLERKGTGNYKGLLR